MNAISARSFRLAAALFFVAVGGDAFAQSASVACFMAPAKTSDADMGSFLTNPNSIISDFPSGGIAMSSKVRGLAGSSSAALDPIISLVQQSTTLQKSAIGSGLARTATSCKAATPDYALLIQQKVAALNDADVTAAFVSALGEVQTASLGAASGSTSAASGIAGGGVVDASSGASTSADTPVTPASESFSVGTRAAFSSFSVQRISVSP